MPYFGGGSVLWHSRSNTDYDTDIQYQSASWRPGISALHPVPSNEPGTAIKDIPSTRNPATHMKAWVEFCAPGIGLNQWRLLCSEQADKFLSFFVSLHVSSEYKHTYIHTYIHKSLTAIYYSKDF